LACQQVCAERSTRTGSLSSWRVASLVFGMGSRELLNGRSGSLVGFLWSAARDIQYWDFIPILGLHFENTAHKSFKWERRDWRGPSCGTPL
jgi:hypothetical protein